MTKLKNSLKYLIISSLFINGFNILPSTASNNVDSILDSKTSAPEVLNQDYLNNIPKNDYILGPGDLLRITIARDYPELFTITAIDGEGTIYLPRLKRIYIEGLSIKELNQLLNNSYKSFIKYPSVEIEIASYRSIKVLVNGEVAKPGLKILKGAMSLSLTDKLPKGTPSVQIDNFDTIKGLSTDNKNTNIELNSIDSLYPDRDAANLYFPTIIDAIRESRGFTEYSDLTNVEIIRRNNISAGGGKIKTTLNIEGTLFSTDDTQNIRIYDGDIINIKKALKPNPFILKKGTQANINPTTIAVLVAGRVKRPGLTVTFRESTLNDAIDLAGGPKIIKGPVRYISLKNDSTIDKRKFPYNRNSKRGTYKNPYLNDGDMIIIGESALSITNEVITEFSRPFTGIFSTYGIIKALSE